MKVSKYTLLIYKKEYKEIKFPYSEEYYLFLQKGWGKYNFEYDSFFLNNEDKLMITVSDSDDVYRHFTFIASNPLNKKIYDVALCSEERKKLDDHLKKITIIEYINIEDNLINFLKTNTDNKFSFQVLINYLLSNIKDENNLITKGEVYDLYKPIVNNIYSVPIRDSLIEYDTIRIKFLTKKKYE